MKKYFLLLFKNFINFKSIKIIKIRYFLQNNLFFQVVLNNYKENLPGRQEIGEIPQQKWNKEQQQNPTNRGTLKSIFLKIRILSCSKILVTGRAKKGYLELMERFMNYELKKRWNTV